MLQKMSLHETPRTAMIRVFGVVLATLALLLAANAASARTAACATHEKMSEQLERKNTEIPVALGLAHSGQLVQVFASEDGATWTVVLTRPDGTSCIAAAGRYWQTVSEKKLGPEA